MDPYVITPAERARFEQQFLSLNPQNGIVTGDQAKGFLLQSQLPPATLGIIWALADTDADGKMNINEFSIACKLINLKLRGFEIPKILPPGLLSLSHQPPVLTAISKPPIPPLPSLVSPTNSILSGLGQVINASVGSGNPPPRPPPAHISPPSGGPSPIHGGAAPPIPPLPIQLPGGSKANLGHSTVPAIPPLVPIQPLAGAHEVPPLPSTPMPLNVPPLVPPLNTSSIAPPGVPAVVPPSTLMGLIGPTQTSPPSQPTPPTPPIPATQHRSGSVADLGVSSTPLVEWAVPQASKLKYTQLFNTTDKNRTGFLTGVQARNILLASKLPQSILADIWALADMDTDGKLSCEEFVLALHLCDMARAGESLPTSLPPNLVPPTLRRVRQNSMGSNSGTPGEVGDPLAGISQVTFEDKRKENFEKGQAELDRRRKALLEIQRKEQEERDRKEREEREKLEKIRLEQERKRQEEFEKELERIREFEMAREEERKRAEEQREAARKEMERQRQLEWENNRRQELENQRRKEQEAVLALKAKNQALAVELSQKEEKVKEISKQISETRCGVTSVKSIIDGMRQTRDTNLAEYNKLKALLKQRNQQLVALSQQKAKLEAQGKFGAKDSADDVLAFNNKTIIVKNLKDKVASLQEEANNKKADLENNNTQLNSLREELKCYLKECEELFDTYASKRNKMLELKESNRAESWGDAAWSAAPASEWPTENEALTEDKPGYSKYRALYEFVARNTDELSFQPGDIILVPVNQNAEPGWLSGELRGMSGWFPESYVEPMSSTVGSTLGAAIVAKTPLEGIAEVGENVSESGSGFGEDKWPESTPSVQADQSSAEIQPVIAGALPPEQQEYYEALYSYHSEEPGDLNFEQGDKILVIGMDGDWWTGTTGGRTGIFPSNYVHKCTSQQPSSLGPVATPLAPEVPTSSQQPSPTPQMEETTARIESKVSPSSVEPQVTGGSRVVTPDFSALASQIESGGEESDSKGKGKKPLIATVIAPYQATSAEQLSLQRGQLIMIRKKTATGWWEGELQAKGKKRQIGWFPASYVKLLAGSGRSSQTHSRKTSESGISDGLLERVVALYPYVAQNEDELSFEKDDVVTILAKDETSWWKGECKGSVGLFPSNYVGPICESNSFNFDPQFIETYQSDHKERSSTSTESAASVDSPSPTVNGVRLKITKEEKKRQQCIQEMIKTEQAYIEDMSIVHDVFEKPLLESNLVTSEQFTTIFINWHDIIECNRALLRSLRVRRSMSKGGIIRMIGDILCENLPRMTVYVRFCSCQLRAASTLQSLTETRPDFQALVKKCQADPRTQGLPLSSFLIKPMQRITKYPLLISKILQHTPSNHPDQSYLEEALAKAEELCSQINEGVREKENSERLEWLQMHVLPAENLSEPLIFNSLTNALGPRKFLHHGILIKRKSEKELVGFLMNDFLFLAQPNRSLGTFNFERHKNVLFKLYKKPLLLNETTIMSSDSTDTPELKLEHNKTVYHLLCPNINEKLLWLRKLTEAQADMRRLESEKFSRQQSKQASFGAVGRILVMVLSGSRLKPVTVRKRKPKFIMFITVLNALELDIKGRVKKDAKTAHNSKRLKQGGREVLCEASMGAQEQRTPPVPMASSSEVVFNSSMQFLVKDLNEDVLCLTVKEKGNFSPDQFLGRTELRVAEFLLDAGASQRSSGVMGRRGPVTKQLKLQEVPTGVINVKLDLHLFHQSD